MIHIINRLKYFLYRRIINIKVSNPLSLKFLYVFIVTLITRPSIIAVIFKNYKYILKLWSNSVLYLSNTGVLFIERKKYLVCIPTSYQNSKNLSQSYLNHKKLKQKCNLLDYKFKQFKNIYIIEKLKTPTLDFDVVSLLLKIHNIEIFNKYDSNTLREYTYNRYFFQSIEIKEICKYIIPNINDKKISYVHGDFHNDNILQNHSEKICIIDLDRFSIYFSCIDMHNLNLMKASKENNVFWSEIALSILEDPKTSFDYKIEIVLFMIFRYYYDTRYPGTGLENYYKKKYKYFFLKAKIILECNSKLSLG